jgi:hypothetical protein
MTVKKCPHCSTELKQILKMSGEWKECPNKNCSFFTSQKVKTRYIRNIPIEEYPEPYTVDWKDK